MTRSGVRRRRRELLQVLLACALGVGAAVLVSACGNSSPKLIPLANAEPLQNDFEAVAQAAESGEGNCSSTESALLKTEQDFGALPASVDSGLRARLREGIAKLREDALAKCEQHRHTTSSTTKTTKSTPTKTQTTPTTSTSTQTTSTETQTTSPPTTTAPGGGTRVPEEEAPGAGGQAGGTGAGEESGTPGSGGEAGAGAPNTPGAGNGQGAASGPPGAGAGQLLRGRRRRRHRFDRPHHRLAKALQR
jgi:hypothetical protein